MEHQKYDKVEAGIVIAILLAMIGWILWQKARAEETTPEQPATEPTSPFDAQQTAVFTVYLTAPDIKKLESKSISVLKKISKLTTAEAQHKVREYGPDGKSYRTLVSRCIQVLSDDALRKVKVLGVERVLIANPNIEIGRPATEVPAPRDPEPKEGL